MHQSVEVTCSIADTEEVEAALWALGCTGIANSVDVKPSVAAPMRTMRLIVGFDTQPDVAALAAELAIRLQGVDTTVSSIEPQTPLWRIHERPRKVGPFTLRLPEHELAQDDTIDLCIEPGDAFGSGSHPSTRLAIDALARLTLDGQTVCDVGCGTGILAIAAAHLGAGPALAIDHDDHAVTISRANVARHRLTNVDVELGSTEHLDSRDFDVVVANVTAAIQVQLGEDLARACSARGVVLLSGILRTQIDDVADHYPDWTQSAVTTEGEWASLILRPPST